MRKLTDPGADPIARAAADWIVRLRDPAAAAGDRIQFSQWLQESPVHVREYLAVAEAWGILHSAQAWPSDSTEDLILAARQTAAIVSISSDETTYAVRRLSTGLGRLRVGTWLSAAATLLAAVGILTFLERHARSGEVAIATVRGEERALDLSDGTVARFNTLTRAVIHYDARVRRVELPEGEAFFRVVHDPRRPFEVITPFAVVRDVGTEFDVYSSRHGTRVAVVAGRVRVTRAASRDGLVPQAADRGERGAGEGTASLEASQVLIVAPGSADIRIATPGAASIATAWLTDRIILDNQRLDAAIAEFNRYNSLQLSLTGSDVGALRMSGVFDANDPQALVAYLERVRGLRITQSPRGILIGRHEP